MKCIVEGCSSEIDELKEFPVSYGPKGAVYDEAGQRAHAAELERWTFVLITARGARDVDLATGHMCPGHGGKGFTIAEKGAA